MIFVYTASVEHEKEDIDNKMLIFALLLIFGVANSCWKKPSGGSEESEDENANAKWTRVPKEDQGPPNRLSQKDSPFGKKRTNM